MMWHNVRATALNATLQLLVIYIDLLIDPPAALVSAGSQSTGFNRLLSSYKPV